MNNAYQKWLAGEGCCNAHNFINIEIPDCDRHDVCDCENILLQISNLHTDDLTLQDEIDELSGKVETLSGEVENKLDTSAYTPVDLTDYATKEWVEDKGYLTTVQPLKTINGESLVGEGNIVISGGSGVTIDAYTKQEADARFQPIGNYALKSEIPSLSGYATEQWVLDKHYITGVDLSDYATQAWVENKNYLTEHQPLKTINGQVISGTGNIVIEASGTSVTVDDHLDSASTNPVQNKVIVGALNGKLDATAYTPTDLSNYYNKTEVNNIVTSAITDVEAEIPSLSGYATEQWVLDKHYISGVDLSDYALKSEIPTVPTSNSAFTNDEHFITSADTVFNNYATTANTYTKTEVNNLISNKIWCGTQAQYDALATKENDVLYLIHE